jgi:hypothetical protein
MTSSLSGARLDRLVLARLAAGPAPRSKQLLEAVRRFWSAATDHDVAMAMERLAREGLIADQAITTRGMDLVHELAADAPWKQVADVALPAYALGWDPASSEIRQRLDDREKWAAAIVARHYGLIAEGKPPPTPAQVANTLVWKRLGLAGKPPRTIPVAIGTLIVGRVLGADVAGWEKALIQLAAKSVRAPRADIRALRDGVVREWLGGRPWTQPSETLTVDPLLAKRESTPSSPSEPVERPDSPQDDLEGFARRVRDAASRARSGVFGDRKVFISALWRALGSDRDTGANLDEFKQRLVEANRIGLLRLYRADLVEEMDPAEVAASATRYLNATFHFVEREASR